MAALDFPATPTNGQKYSPAGGPTYTFDGVSWSSEASPAPISDFNAALSYAANALVIYNGTIYRAKAAVPVGAWDATKWEAVSSTRDTISVKDFGAKGDGTTDDTAAIQAAITFCKGNAQGPKAVEFPTGAYKVSSTINIVGGYMYGLSIIGNKSVIVSTAPGATFLFDAVTGGAASEYRQQSVMRDLTITGPGKTAVGSIGIKLDQIAQLTFDNVTVRLCETGIFGKSALILDFLGVCVRETVTGVKLTAGVAGSGDRFIAAPNDIKFTNCRIVNNTQALYATTFSIGAISFWGCEIEGNNFASGTAADPVRICEFLDAGQVNFFGCHFENNSGNSQIYYDAGTTGSAGLTIVGSQVTPGSKCATGVYMQAGNLQVIGGRLITTATPIQSVYLNTGATAFLATQGISVAGDTSKCVEYYAGTLAVSGRTSGAPAKFTVRGANAASAAMDVRGYIHFSNDTNVRTGYITSNTWAVDGTSNLRLSANSSGLELGRVASTIEPLTNNTVSFGSTTRLWKEAYVSTIRPGSGTAQWTSGAGTPEGVVTAPVGSLFTRTDGAAATTLYVKETGTGNTGWVAK